MSNLGHVDLHGYIRAVLILVLLDITGEYILGKDTEAVISQVLNLLI